MNMKWILTFVCVIFTSFGMKFDKTAPLSSSGALGSSAGSSTHSNTDPQDHDKTPTTSTTLPQMIGLSAFDVENLMNRAGTGLSHSKGATIQTSPSYFSVKTTNTHHLSKTVNDPCYAKSVSFVDYEHGQSINSPQSSRIIAQSSNENEIMDTLSSIDTNNPLFAPRMMGITSRGSSIQPIKPKFNAPIVLNTKQLSEETIPIPVNHETDQSHQTSNTVPQMKILEIQMTGTGSGTPPSPLAGSIPQAQSSSVNTIVIPQIMGSTKTDKIMTVEATTQTTPKKTDTPKESEDESRRNIICCILNCPMNCPK